MASYFNAVGTKQQGLTYTNYMKCPVKSRKFHIGIIFAFYYARLLHELKPAHCIYHLLYILHH